MRSLALSGLFAAAFCLLAAPIAQAALLPSGYYYQETGGQVVGEGEIFTARVNTPYPDSWLIVPDEDPGAGTLLGARGDGLYVQSLPDQAGGGGGPNVPPEIHYGMNIVTTGLYQLYLRKANNTNVGNGGNSDSMFVDVIEMKDGSGGSIADWYEMVNNSATFVWDGGGQAEANSAGAADNPMTWNITTPGIYTLRFTQREDGSAVDAWAFQLSSQAAPTGTSFGPAMSQLIPEPATLLIWSLLAGLGIGLGWRRRK